VALAIKAEGLSRRYGDRLAVDGVDLAVPPGEVFGFLGANGAGKSTTIKMLLGLVRPTAGTALLFDKPPTDVDVRRRIGFLPEHYRFPDWLTAEELMYVHGRLLRLSAAERKKRAAVVLERVGLAARRGDRLRTFSKGMLQRAGLAQALMGQPSVIFLDEPTSGLDPVGRADVRALIQRLREEGTTVFLNSHILSDVEAVCDRVAILRSGRVAAQGSLTQLLQTDAEAEVRVGNVAAETMRSLGWPATQVNGNLWRVHVSDEAATAELARKLVVAGADLYGLAIRQRSLEDLFLGLARPEEQRAC